MVGETKLPDHINKVKRQGAVRNITLISKVAFKINFAA